MRITVRPHRRIRRTRDIETGIEHGDDDALALGRDVAERAGAVPDGRRVDHARTAIGIDLHFRVGLDAHDTVHRGELHGFGVAEFGDEAVISMLERQQRRDRTAELRRCLREKRVLLVAQLRQIALCRQRFQRDALAVAARNAIGQRERRILQSDDEPRTLHRVAGLVHHAQAQALRASHDRVFSPCIARATGRCTGPEHGRRNRRHERRPSPQLAHSHV